jgi:sec-independent protein translocase protein TatC
MSRESPDFEDPDDYFSHTRMSLGDHIEELRVALWRAIKGLVLGMLVGFFLAQPALGFISHPVEKQLAVFQEERLKSKMKELREDMENNRGRLLALNAPQPLEVMISHDPVQATLRQCQTCHGATVQQGDLRLDSREALLKGGKEGPAIDPEDPENSLLLQAIRKDGKLTRHPKVHVSEKATGRLTAWIKKDAPWPEKDDREDAVMYIYPAMVWEMLDPVYREISHPPILRALSITEGIIIWMKLGFYLGVILASPWIFYQIWMFIAAGLYPEEKRLVNYYLPVSIALFLAGVTLCYFILPIGIHYLLNFNAWLNIEPDLRLTEWLSFAILMPVIFGVAFQLPLVMFALDRFGILSVDFYFRYWKIVILVLLVLSGFFQASPDPLSMFLLAVPMWCLYGLGILMCKMVPKPTSDLEMPDPEEMVEV